MTPDEKLLLLWLCRCSMLPASRYKKFRRRLTLKAEGDLALTPRERDTLCSMVYRFRRQIPQGVVSIALDLMSPAAPRLPDGAVAAAKPAVRPAQLELALDATDPATS